MDIRIAGIYLGAGAGTRMGGPKLSLKMPDGRRLGFYALTEAMRSELNAIYVVGRSPERADWLPDEFASVEKEGRCKYIYCDDADGGMSHSIRCGIRAAEEHDAWDAAVVLLADQPLVHARMIDELAERFRSDPSLDYVASGCRGKAMPPALFSRRLFPELKRLRGDAGARAVFSSSDYKGSVIEQEPVRFADADTQEDVARIIKIWESL